MVRTVMDNELSGNYYEKMKSCFNKVSGTAR